MSVLELFSSIAKKNAKQEPSFRQKRTNYSTLLRVPRINGLVMILFWCSIFRLCAMTGAVSFRISSLFYVTQWVGRTNLTLLDENGPVFRLAREDAR
jgi:hypothetical protein